MWSSHQTLKTGGSVGVSRFQVKQHPCLGGVRSQRLSLTLESVDSLRSWFSPFLDTLIMIRLSRASFYTSVIVVFTGIFAPPLAAAEPPSLDTVDAQYLQNIQRVAVASFVVQYVVAQEATSRGGANSGIDFTTQLQRERLQATTEAIYQQFLKSVQGAGLDMVTPQALAESPSFKKMLELSAPTPREESTWSRGKGGGYNSVFVTPQGMPLVLHEDFDHLMNGFSSVGDPTLSFAGRLSLYSTNWAYYDKDLQKDLGAATLHVRLFVPLAVTSTNTWMAANWQRDRSTTTAALRIGERLSRMSVGNNGGITKITLKTPIFMDGLIGESNAPRSGPTLTGLLFGKSDNTTSFALDADGYFKEVPAAAATVLDAFVQRLR